MGQRKTGSLLYEGRIYSSSDPLGPRNTDTENDAQLCQSLGKRGLQSRWFTQFATDIHEPLPCSGRSLLETV